jgi:hypothetical protein
MSCSGNGGFFWWEAARDALILAMVLLCQGECSWVVVVLELSVGNFMENLVRIYL